MLHGCLISSATVISMVNSVRLYRYYEMLDVFKPLLVFITVFSVLKATVLTDIFCRKVSLTPCISTPDNNDVWSDRLSDQSCMFGGL